MARSMLMGATLQMSFFWPATGSHLTSTTGEYTNELVPVVAEGITPLTTIGAAWIVTYFLLIGAGELHGHDADAKPFDDRVLGVVAGPRRLWKIRGSPAVRR